MWIQVLLAQTPTTDAASQGIGMLEGAIGLADSIIKGWQGLWIDIFSPDSAYPGLWLALINLGRLFGGIGLLFLTLDKGKEIMQSFALHKLIEMIVWPLIVAFFIAGNGGFLGETILNARNAGYGQIQRVLQTQVADMTMQQALAVVSTSITGKQQLEVLYAECSDKTGSDLAECLKSKQADAQKIMDGAKQRSGGHPLVGLTLLVAGFNNAVLNPLGQVVNAGKAILNPGGFLRNMAVPILRFILWGLQWAFANCVEAALLLHCLLAPIAMGLSIMPLATNYFVAWLSGFFGLLMLQLSYGLITGVAALVLVQTGLEVVSDIAFLIFLSIFAPLLASAIAAGGGMALYQGFSSAAGRVVSFYSGVVSTAVQTAAIAAKGV